MGIENPKPTPDITIVKTADETVNNSNVLQDDDELVYSSNLASASLYQIFIYMIYTSDATADIKINPQISANGNMVFVANYFSTALALTVGAFGVNIGTGFSSDLTCGGNGANLVIATLNGYLRTGNASTFKVRWAQATAQLLDTVVKAGSRLEITKV